MVRTLLKRIGKLFTRTSSPASAPAKSGAVPPAAAPHKAHAPRPPVQRTEHRPAAAHAAAHPAAHAAAAHKPRHPHSPRDDAWKPAQFQVPPLEGKVRFHDLGLPDPIMHAVADSGFQYCTPVQALSLPPALEGKDVTGRAQTGTGKTAAFLIAMMTRFIHDPRTEPVPKATPRALIIAPTRELAIQIERDAQALEYHTAINSRAIFGGMDYMRQKEDLKKFPVDIVVATPGRLLDFCQSGDLHLNQVEVLVIDEADRMLDMGFIPDVRRIIRLLPPREKRQTLLYSATLSSDILRLAAQWMRDPVRIEIEPEKVTVDSVNQIVYMVGSHQKLTLLYNIIRHNSTSRILVFGNRRDQTMHLTDHLTRHGINCALLSGDVAQNKRLRILDGFRDNTIQVLVATDVAGRGIHVDDITHVINFDIPYEAEDYVHRIGRTGRAGASGTAITFACEDAFDLPQIEKFIGRALQCIQPPEELLKPLPPPVRPASSEYAPQERRSGGGGGRPMRGSKSPSSYRSRPPRRH